MSGFQGAFIIDLVDDSFDIAAQPNANALANIDRRIRELSTLAPLRQRAQIDFAALADFGGINVLLTEIFLWRHLPLQMQTSRYR